MLIPEAFTRRAKGVPAHAFVASLAIGLAGAIVFPVGYAVENARGKTLSTDQRLQVGHSIGRIEKIDIERAAVMIKHGPIEGLGMPDMTMIFRLADPRQLTGLHVGDQVRFEVRNIKGAMVISEISNAR